LNIKNKTSSNFELVLSLYQSLLQSWKLWLLLDSIIDLHSVWITILFCCNACIVLLFIKDGDTYGISLSLTLKMASGFDHAETVTYELD